MNLDMDHINPSLITKSAPWSDGMSLLLFSAFDIFLSFASCIPGGLGGLIYERSGDACRKFWIKPLKETYLGMVQTFF